MSLDTNAPIEGRRDWIARDGARWSEKEEQKMLVWHFAGEGTLRIAHSLQRKGNAIESRLAMFGLAPYRFKPHGQQLRLPLLIDCGQCGRPMYACTCAFGV